MRIVRRERAALILSAALLLAVIAFYSDTFVSMARVWFTSSTFVHGLLILPMSAYLIWRNRAEWLPLAPKPSVLGVLAMLASVVVWILGQLVAVQVVAQLAVIAMMVAGVLSILGLRIVGILRFPLFYAFFAVPFGEFLVPSLMNWTADATVFALQFTGIPVLREGNFFALPSGNFEVIEACSGVKYLIVMVVLGFFFVHETYRSWTKRAVFLVAVVMSIVLANWLRAYLVVLIAHLTQLQYGTGESHLYMGWVIFLMVISVLFWIGHKYEDPPRRLSRDIGMSEGALLSSQRGSIDMLVVFLLVLAMLFAGAAFPDWIRSRIPMEVADPMLPVLDGTWTGPLPPYTAYAPTSNGASTTLTAAYSRGDTAIEVHVVFYAEQQQGGELVGWHSKPVDTASWRRYREAVERVRVDETDLAVRSLVIANDSRDLMIWYWYDVAGLLTSSPGLAKMNQAWGVLRGVNRGDALIVLATEVRDHRSDEAHDSLASFLASGLDGLRRCLRPDIDHDSTCIAGK